MLFLRPSGAPRRFADRQGAGGRRPAPGINGQQRVAVARTDHVLAPADHRVSRLEQAMALFELTLILLLIAVALTALSRWLEVPYPSLLALAGVGIAFLPGAPTIEIGRASCRERV